MFDLISLNVFIYRIKRRFTLALIVVLPTKQHGDYNIRGLYFGHLNAIFHFQNVQNYFLNKLS